METMNTIVPSCTCQDAMIQESVQQAARTQLAAVTSSRSIDLDLVTEEGDKVTLSIDAKAFALYAAYGEVQVDGDGISAQWSELSAGQYERDMALTVEGDLNRQERREIRKVIKAINQMMNDFVQGKMEPMLSKAEKLGGLETIDSLELEMSYERQVVVAQQTQSSATYNQFGQSASGQVAETAAPAMPLAAEARSLARNMAREVVSTPASREPILRMTDHLFRSHRRRARRLGPMGAGIMDHVRDLFRAAVGETKTSAHKSSTLTVAADNMEE